MDWSNTIIIDCVVHLAKYFVDAWSGNGLRMFWKDGIGRLQVSGLRHHTKTPDGPETSRVITINSSELTVRFLSKNHCHESYYKTI